MEHQELDLRELVQVIRRRLWLIVALPLVAAAAAALISFFVLTPIYSASTTLLVIKEDSAQLTLQDLQLSRNLTRTYAEVAKSRAVVGDAIRLLELPGLTVKELQDKLTVATVRDTEILSFTVQDPDPALAARMADAVALAFQDRIRSFVKIENVSIVDRAEIPTSPVKPRPLMNTALAGVLGGMLALGLAFLLEFLDTSIKTPSDVSRRLGLPVIGTIPVITPQGTEDRRLSRNTKKTETVVQEP